MGPLKSAITAVGGYLPEFVMTNKILEGMVDTSDEWITTRTGIRESRVLKGEGRGTSEMLVKAGEEALRKRGIEASEVDLVLAKRPQLRGRRARTPGEREHHTPGQQQTSTDRCDESRHPA